jgi:2-polyprenyl-3-methyl-5-hydroxy-6-metoxy-1,4-benzoquinol methylase
MQATHKTSITTFYDEKYREYQHPNPETWLEKAYVRLKKYELHRNQAAINLLEPATRILDIGAGYGDLLSKAAAKGFTQVYGIDISPVVIKHCQEVLHQQKIKGHVSVQNIDEGTNFKSGFFDAVTMIAVLEHVFSPNQVLAEINRVLKPGGQLILEVPNVVFLPRRWSFLTGKLPKTSDEPLYEDGHLQFFTAESLSRLLIKHGLEIEYLGSSGIFAGVRNWWPTLLGANIVVKARKV